MLTLWEWMQEHHDPEYLQRLNEQRNRMLFELSADLEVNGEN